MEMCSGCMNTLMNLEMSECVLIGSARIASLAASGSSENKVGTCIHTLFIRLCGWVYIVRCILVAASTKIICILSTYRATDVFSIIHLALELPAFQFHRWDIIPRHIKFFKINYVTLTICSGGSGISAIAYHASNQGSIPGNGKI